MLTDNDINFSDADRQALIDSTASGEGYRIRGVIINITNEEGQIEWIRRMDTYDSFTELLGKTATIECINDDCSIVKFIDSKGNELEQLTTTSEFGSVLSSKPNIYFGHSNFIKE